MSEQAMKNGTHLRAIDLARTLVSQMPEATNAQLVPKMQAHGYTKHTSELNLGRARTEAGKKKQVLKDRGLDLREERFQEDLFSSLEKVAEKLEKPEVKKPQENTLSSLSKQLFNAIADEVEEAEEDTVNVAALIAVSDLVKRLGHDAVGRALDVLEKLGGVK